METVKVRNVEIGAGIPKICVPIVGTTGEEILDAAEDIAKTAADIVEWRADWYEDIFRFDRTRETLAYLRSALGEIPLLFTFRTAGEGGARAIDKDEYVELNRKICGTGMADLIDVEAFTGDEEVEKVIAAAHEKGVRVIGSNHDFQKTPDKIENLFQERLFLREEGSGTREVLERYLDSKNLGISDFSRVTEVGSLQAIKELTKAGCGITFLYEAAVAGELKSGELTRIPLLDFQISHEFAFIWRRGSIYADRYRELFRRFSG